MHGIRCLLDDFLASAFEFHGMGWVFRVDQYFHSACGCHKNKELLSEKEHSWPILLDDDLVVSGQGNRDVFNIAVGWKNKPHEKKLVATSDQKDHTIGQKLKTVWAHVPCIHFLVTFE